MADALWNDIVYTDVLQSDGFVIDYAVCTTYSLDMPSLLSVPFMLGTMTDLTEAAMRSPHLILETINRQVSLPFSAMPDVWQYRRPIPKCIHFWSRALYK